MNYDVGACKNCAQIAGTTKDHKCEACGADKNTVPLYTWFHQDYDVIEDGETIDRLDEMDNTEVKASAVGGAELKAGLRDLIICVGIAIALVLFGLLCIKGAGGSVKGRMSFMGILFLIAAPITLILGVYLFCKRAFSSARAKTPEKAFELFWKAVFETKTFSDKYEKAEMAVEKITRSLPAAVRPTLNQDRMMAWVTDLRNTIAKSNSELAQDSYKAYKEQLFDAHGENDSLTIQDTAAEAVDEHKTVVSANLVIVRKWTRSVQRRNNTDYYTYQMAAGVLHVKTTLLKAGEYWYVPDWMPEIEKGELVDAWREANP